MGAAGLVQHMHMHRVSPFAAGLVQCVLGKIQHTGGRVGVFRAKADADLGSQEQGVGQYRERKLDLLADLFCQVFGRRRLGAAGHRDQELVAAVPP